MVDSYYELLVLLILYHPILAWEDSVDWICEGYFSICTSRVSSHSVATLHRWSINACPVRLFFISICRFFTSVRRNFFLDGSLHSSMCSCNSVWRHIAHFGVDDCFILCNTFIVGRIPLHTFVITTSQSVCFTAKEVLCIATKLTLRSRRPISFMNVIVIR